MMAFKKYGYAVFSFDLPFHGERGCFRDEFFPTVIREGSEEIVDIAEFLRRDSANEVYIVSRSLGSIVSAVALGKGARIEKAALLLASANLTHVFTHGRGRTYFVEKWEELGILTEIDPIYFLPYYKGKIHFHCGKKDMLLTPEACEMAYEACVQAEERKLIWHEGGHSMPLNKYFNEMLAFFEEQ